MLRMSGFHLSTVAALLAALPNTSNADDPAVLAAEKTGAKMWGALVDSQKRAAKIATQYKSFSLAPNGTAAFSALLTNVRGYLNSTVEYSFSAKPDFVELEDLRFSIPLSAGTDYSHLEGCEIYASDGTYLGSIMSNKFSSDSIINQFGAYGSSVGTNSIRNEFGSYGSSFSSKSAYNPFASSPPRIYRESTFLAYLTTNTVKSPRVDPDELIAYLEGNSSGASPTVTGQIAVGIDAPAGTYEFLMGLSFKNPDGVEIGYEGISFSVTVSLAVTTVTGAGQPLTVIAGNGTQGYSGDGGPATAASLSAPTDVVVDGAGNLYIADFGNNRIRKVDLASGIITTVAGNGSFDVLDRPSGLALDGTGNIYVSLQVIDRICKVALTSGTITTIAGNGTEGSERGYAGDGGAATAANLYDPSGVAVDGSGNLYIADTVHNRIRKVDLASGIITTVAGNGTRGYSGDGGPATAAQLLFPNGVAIDGAGNLYIADGLNLCIRKVDLASGIITTIAANLDYYPHGVAVDGAGSLYIGAGPWVYKLSITLPAFGSRLAGDFNSDGKINFSDFFLFADAFGGTDPVFDLNDDGKVNFSDFFLFVDAFDSSARDKLLALAQEYLGLPAYSQLEPNYPNPFNASTIIPYRTAAAGPVCLAVYSLTGQLTRTLVQGNQLPGRYDVVWDGRDESGRAVASGIYFCQLETSAGVRQIRRMLLLK